MSRITIPTTIKEATAALAALDDLVTAKEWSRAAIVHAFTYDAGRGGTRGLNPPKGRLTVADFARRGINGLTNPKTVTAYRANWKLAMAAGEADDIAPGDRVDLPDMEWPGRNDSDGKRRYVEKIPSNMARALGNFAEHEVEAFAQDLDPATAEAILARIAEDRPAVVAKIVTETPGAARAIARNEAAVEAVEEEGIAFRGGPDGPGIDPKAVGRKVAHNVNRALGGDDLATEELKHAARFILQAKAYCDDFGIEDGAAEQEALGRCDRALDAYRNRSNLTDDDAAFAAAHGIQRDW